MATERERMDELIGQLEQLADNMARHSLRNLRQISCEAAGQNLVAFLKDELDQENRGEIHTHLQICGLCREEAKSLADTLGVSAIIAEEEPVVRIVNSFLQAAINDNASDIHVEHTRQGTRVRFRIDGVLHEIMKAPSYVHQPLVNHIKIMADMNVAEHRLPQEGRIHVRKAGTDYDLRAAVFPFQRGEKVVMRIFEKSAVVLGLERMGLFPDQEAKVHGLLQRPSGLLLVAGPTGCGKTTVAYGMLNSLDKEKLNIVTIEDPVIYRFDGITSVNVNRKLGLTYPDGVRMLLQRDPDVIFIGEIQDRDTAEAALEAGLTGHLVLSVMHAADAVDAIARLQRFGVDAALLSSALLGVVSTRLVRRICDNCRQDCTLPAEALRSLGIPSEAPGQYAKGAGCEECRGTGHRGRIGVFEVLEVGEETARSLRRAAGEASLYQTAVPSGMDSIVQSAARLVREGITTAEDALRVTGDLRERRGE